MKFNRVFLSEETSKKLQILKSKTGITPNVLCRMGIMLSFRDQTIPSPELYKQDGQELQRQVLLGDLEPLIIALLKEKALLDGIDLHHHKVLFEYFRAHLNRGAELIYNRISSLQDITFIIS